MDISLKSSFYDLFKNMAHVVPMFKFNQNRSCLFVYLSICVWVTREWSKMSYS